MERHKLGNPREVRPRTQETKCEEKEPAGLAEYANSPPPASPPGPSPLAAPPSLHPPPSSVSSIPNFEGDKPFWEPDYPSQRFRPEKTGAEDPDNLYYSPPPQLFSPPISPNEIHHQHITPGKTYSAAKLQTMTPTPKDPSKGEPPTPFVPAYKGFTFTPAINLTTYGAFADRSKLQDASLGGVYTLMNPSECTSDAAEKPNATNDGPLSATNAIAREVPKHSEDEESHPSSEAEIHPCAGVPLNIMDGEIPTMNEHQEKSFEELETERGIMEWNNTVFDERWLEPAQPNSKQPDDRWRPTTPGIITGKHIEHTSSKHQRWISFLRELEETRKKMDLSARFKPDPLIWGVDDRAPTPEKIIHREQPTQEPVPEPLWPGRLQKVVCELEGGTGELPHGITDRPDVLRRYFYDRVFLEGWEWVGTDEQKMTKSGGRICSVGAVREQALKDIEDLISFMTAPVGHGIRKVTFPRTPEAAAMMKEDPFGGNSANPREEHFMRRFRRIGGYAKFTSLNGYEGRNAVAEAMGVQASSHADCAQDVCSQPLSATTVALTQHESGQKLALAQSVDVGHAGADLAQKHTSEPIQGQASTSKGFLNSKNPISSPPGNGTSNKHLAETETRGASGLDGRSISEEVPVRHNNHVETTAATFNTSSLRQHQQDSLYAASENRSSSQATLTAESDDHMEPSPYHLTNDQHIYSDTNFTKHMQYQELLSSPYATQALSQDQRLPLDLVHARMFKRSDWESYVPLSSVIEHTRTQQSPMMPSGPPPSTMHPGYRHQQSTVAPKQFETTEFEQPACGAPQHDVRRPTWNDAHAQQPFRSITQRTAYAGPEQTAYGRPPQTSYPAPQCMQYGFPQQAVGYAGSSTTDTEFSTACQAPASRYTYVTQNMMNQHSHSWTPHTSQPLSYKNSGVRAPAPNRFAAVLARSKEFENYGIPQACGTPTPIQAFRQPIRATTDSAQAFAQNQIPRFPVPSEAHIQTQYGGAPIQNHMRGAPIPPQAFLLNRVRGTPAPDAAYIQSQFGQDSAPSKMLPQYPIRGTPAPFQPVPDGHIRSTRTPTQVLQNSYEWQSRFGIPQDMVKPDLPILHYRDGSDDMRPHYTKGMPTVAYQNLVRNLEHRYDAIKAAEHLPFTETAKDSKPVEWGVLKIGNIPYDINRDLVVSFLGIHAKLITANLGPAIHIIMDRVSGKTMDCFVEFLSPLDARATCNSINLRQRGLIRISDRVVDVNMSSQNELLAALFQKAKDVKWVNGKPIVMQPKEEWSSGFKSFVSAEELGLMVKHAEQPHRSNYTQRSPQRCYESMISLLAKFPWHSVENYTLHQRNLIFNATRQMLQILSVNIRKQCGRENHSRGGSTLSYTTAVSHGSSDRNSGNDRYGISAIAYGGDTNINPGSKSAEALTEDLLKDLLSAGVNAAGFSENQRWQLHEACEYAKHHFLVSPMLQYWPFEVLGRKVRIEEDVLEFYARIIACNPEVEQTGLPFGSLRNITTSIDMESQTMDKIGSMELNMLEALLKSGIDNALTQHEAERDMAALTL